MSLLKMASKGFEPRMRIVNAIDTLVKEKSFEGITIGEICQEAGFARQTFYRYFADKNDAVFWYANLSVREIVAQTGKSITWHEEFLLSSQNVVSSAGFYSAVFRPSRDFNSLPNELIRLTEHEYRKTLNEYIRIEITPALDFQLRLWCRTVMESGIDWLADGLRHSAEEYAAYLDKCVPRDLYEIMNSSVLNRRADIEGADNQPERKPAKSSILL